MRENRAGSTTSGECNPEQYSKSLTNLQHEQEKERPSRKTVRQLMKATYEGMLHLVCVCVCACVYMCVVYVRVVCVRACGVCVFVGVRAFVYIP